jgi:hypothetical protein
MDAFSKTRCFASRPLIYFMRFHFQRRVDFRPIFVTFNLFDLFVFGLCRRNLIFRRTVNNENERSRKLNSQNYYFDFWSFHINQVQLRQVFETAAAISAKPVLKYRRDGKLKRHS